MDVLHPIRAIPCQTKQVIVIVCPGQGSQTPGFLEPWLENSDSKALLESLSAASHVDLIAHGTTSDADTIRDTAVAQPLIVAAGIVAFSALTAGIDTSRIGGIAGHSVGELTAAAGAGVLSADDAIRFVSVRGNEMASAAAREASGMSAVLGGDPDELLALCASLELEPANFNGGGQIVVAGALDKLAALSEAPPAKARVIPLQVAGAFHTRFMAPAVAPLREAAAALSVNDPSLDLWTNFDGTRVTSGSRFVELLVNQVSSPVRWDKCMESFLAHCVTGIIELAPAGALTGLAKRAMRGVPAVAVKTPEDLVAARELIAASA